MHVTDDRVGRDDALTIEAYDNPQGAVRGRVLRTDVEHHVARVELDVHLRVGEVAERRGIDCNLGKLTRGREVGRGHVASPPSSVSSAPGPPGIGSTSTRPGHGFTSRASNG